MELKLLPTLSFCTLRPHQLYFVILLLLSILRTVFAIQIRATAPVKEVKEGGILSLHCQISDFESTSHNVIVSRDTGTGNVDLSWNDVVIVKEPEIQERLYLATRQLGDGSLVYFLSLTDVTRQDEGQYSCKVLSSTSYAVITQKDVQVSVKYFPTSNPTCSTTDVQSGYWFDEGAKIVLNCTSEQSSPPLTLQWSHSDSNEILGKTVVYEGTKKTSTALRRTLTMRDDKKVFECKMSSPYFPGVSLKCHIGPIRVKQNDNMADLVVSDYGIYDSETVSSEQNPLQPLDCLKQCTSSKETEYYWILSTVIAGILAFTLCVAAFILVCKYYRLTTEGRQELGIVTRHPPLDDLYEKVQCREDGGMVYMSLKKTMKPGNPVMYVQKENGTHYNITPSNEPVRYPSQFS